MNFKLTVKVDDGIYRNGKFVFDFKIPTSYPHVSHLRPEPRPAHATSPPRASPSACPAPKLTPFSSPPPITTGGAQGDM